MTYVSLIEAGNYGAVIRDIIATSALTKLDDEHRQQLENETGMDVSHFVDMLSSAIQTMDENMSRDKTDLLISAQIKANPQMEAALLRAAIDAKEKDANE